MSSRNLFRPVLLRAKTGVDATHFGFSSEFRVLRLLGAEIHFDFPMGASNQSPPWSANQQFFFPLHSKRGTYFAPQLSFLWQSSKLLIPFGARFQFLIEELLCRLESAVLFRSSELSARSLFLVEYPVSGSPERGAFVGLQIDHEYRESQDFTVGGQVTAGLRF